MARRKRFTFGPPLPLGAIAALALVGVMGLKSGWEYFRPGALEPPRLMSGVWLDKFEGQSFLEGATNWVDPKECGTSTWIDIDQRTIDKIHKETLREGEQAPFVYRISFIGRRTRYDGDYGHMGLYRHMIRVKEIRSATRLQPPAHMTFAQVQRPCGGPSVSR